MSWTPISEGRLLLRDGEVPTVLVVTESRKDRMQGLLERRVFERWNLRRAASWKSGNDRSLRRSWRAYPSTARMSTPRTGVGRGRVLAACVAEHDWSAAPPSIEGELPVRHPTSLVAAARFHGVTGCVYQSLRHVVPGDAGAADALEPFYLGSIRSHLEVLAALSEVAQAFADAVPWMVLKGPVLAEVVYRRPDLRSYGDLDLLVPPRHFGAALDALEAAGFRVEDRNWDLVRRRMLGEIQLTSPGGTAVDLHWHPLNDATLRHTFAVDAATLFERARSVRLGTNPVRTLSPADTLVHLSLHSAQSGGNRLVWLKDIEQAVLYDRPPWTEVVEVASRWRAGPACALMLRRAQRSLGALVPPEVLEALERDSRWCRMASTVDRLGPVERALGHRSPARAVARATRADDRSSLIALASAALQAARRGGLTHTPPRPDADPASQGSIYHATGGETGRARFVAEVSRRS